MSQMTSTADKLAAHGLVTPQLWLMVYNHRAMTVYVDVHVIRASCLSTALVMLHASALLL